jgi:hypothetical protein
LNEYRKIINAVLNYGVQIQRLEAELGEVRESEHAGLVAGVKNGVNSDAAGCSQMGHDVSKSKSFRAERCVSGRNGTPGERVYPQGTVGSNPTLSAFSFPVWTRGS